MTLSINGKPQQSTLGSPTEVQRLLQGRQQPCGPRLVVLSAKRLCHPHPKLLLDLACVRFVLHCSPLKTSRSSYAATAIANLVGSYTSNTRSCKDYPPVSVTSVCGREFVPSSNNLQRAALGQSQGLVKSLPESSTGWSAILQLLCSQTRNNLQEELLKRNKQNLGDGPSAAGCCSYKNVNVNTGFSVAL